MNAYNIQGMFDIAEFLDYINLSHRIDMENLANSDFHEHLSLFA